MRVRVIGFQIYSALELPFGLRPIPVIIGENFAHRGMSFGEAFIYAQSLRRSLSGQGQHITGLHDKVTAERRVSVCQPDVSQSKVAVFVDGLIIGFDALPHAFASALVPVVTPLQVKLISFVILRIAFGQLALLVAVQTQPQRLGYLAGDLLLHGQQVGERALIAFAPELRAGGGIHQLNVDDQPVAQALHAACDYRAYLQRLAHLTRIDFAPFVGKDDAARHHSAQRGQLRQAVDQVLGDAVRQVLHLWIGAYVGKGQHRDRINRSLARREPLPPSRRRDKRQRQRQRRQRQAFAVTQPQPTQDSQPRGRRRDDWARQHRRLVGGGGRRSNRHSEDVVRAPRAAFQLGREFQLLFQPLQVVAELPRSLVTLLDRLSQRSGADLLQRLGQLRHVTRHRPRLGTE